MYVLTLVLEPIFFAVFIDLTESWSLHARKQGEISTNPLEDTLFRKPEVRPRSLTRIHGIVLMNDIHQSVEESLK